VTRYGIKTYTDPNSDTKPIIIGKGKTAFDAGVFYAPYIPLQPVNIMEPNRIAAQGQLWGWSTFIVNGDGAEVIQWCQENFSRRHRGIYLQGSGLWLGNFGRWRYDGRSLNEIGVIPNYVRIWLHREDDIALFKLRWV
jgi:hypothetical protein